MTNVSRRSVAQGAAWAMPAIAVAASAPSVAASVKDIVSGTVCQIFEGGGTVNQQTQDVTLGINSSQTTIPKGTVVTWTVNMDGSQAWKTIESGTTPAYTQVPTSNYSANNSWSLTTSPAAGTQTSSFTVTWTALTDVAAADVACSVRLIWNDTYLVDPGVAMTVSSTTTGPNTTGQAAALAWRVPRRWSSSTRNDHALIFQSKSGAQSCYPPVQYSYVSGAVAAMGTNGSTCAAAGGNNSSTTYPDGTCQNVKITSGQATVPQKC